MRTGSARSGRPAAMAEFDDAVVLDGGGPGVSGRHPSARAGWSGRPSTAASSWRSRSRRCARAVEDAGGHGDPLVFSAYFLSAAQTGPARVRPEILRTGRSMSSAAVSVSRAPATAAVERMRAHGDLRGPRRPVRAGVALAAAAGAARPRDACIRASGPRPSSRGRSDCSTGSTCASTPGRRAGPSVPRPARAGSGPGCGSRTAGSRMPRPCRSSSTPSCRWPSTSGRSAGLRRSS